MSLDISLILGGITAPAVVPPYIVIETFLTSVAVTVNPDPRPEAPRLASVADNTSLMMYVAPSLTNVTAVTAPAVTVISAYAPEPLPPVRATPVYVPSTYPEPPTIVANVTIGPLLGSAPIPRGPAKKLLAVPSA